MPTTIRFWLSSCACFLAALFLVLVFGNGLAWAEESRSTIAPKPLIDFTSPDAVKQVTATKGIPANSVVTVDKTGISMSFPPQKPTDGKHPGVHVTPATGKLWDLSAYGHVEAKITSTSDKQRFDVVMHVVDQGVGFWAERNMEAVSLQPGETKTLRVIFGYQKGFKSGPPLKASSVTEIYLYLWDKAQARSFRIEELKAAGPAGEKPVIDPKSPATQPSSATKP
jgi:hypothetical protein